MLARIKNAYAVGKKEVSLPYTKMCEDVARVMLTEKYLSGIEISEDKMALKLNLQYVKDRPALSAARRVSKPGVRIYSGISKLKPVLSGLGMSVISTPRGVMSGSEAKKQHVGGEVLAELW